MDFGFPGEGKKGEVNSPFRDFRDSRVKDCWIYGERWKLLRILNDSGIEDC